jgi:hypothetical protein
VNRDPEQYRCRDAAYDRKLAQFLIDALLLKKAVSFPMPGVTDAVPAGVVQHAYVGRAFPEDA